MKIKLTNFLINAFLKLEGISKTKFAYNYSFMNGDYMVFQNKELGYKVGFGKKTKASKVIFLEMDKKLDSKLLDLFQVDCPIGEEHPLKGDDLRGNIVSNIIDNFEVSFWLDESLNIQKVLIIDKDGMKENLRNLKQLLKFENTKEVDNANEVLRNLIGKWKFSPILSKQLNVCSKSKDWGSRGGDENSIVTYSSDNIKSFINYKNKLFKSMFKITKLNKDNSFEITFVDTSGSTYKERAKFENNLLVFLRNDAIGFKGDYRVVHEKIDQ